MELVRDLSITGVRREDVKDRDGKMIQAASPACGGTLLGKRSGAGSVIVSESDGKSSSDIFRVTKKRHLNKK
jgi:hypothetical protein